MEPTLALIIVSNIDQTIQYDYGREFRQVMKAIRRKYDYDIIHDATSVAFILKEMAKAHGVQNLHDTPDVNALGQQGVANAVAESVSYMQELMHSNSSAYSSYSESAHSATSDSNSSEDTKTRHWYKRDARLERAKKAEKKKKQERRTRRRRNEEKKLLSIYKDRMHCKNKQK